VKIDPLTLVCAGLLGWCVQLWAWPAAAPWPLACGLLLGMLSGTRRLEQKPLK
jgi:hypothetical protein